MAIPIQLKHVLTQATTVEQLGIPPTLVTDLMFRMLFNEGEVSVARLCDVIRVYPQIIDDFLMQAQHDHLVEVAKAGSIRFSYVYRLTDDGAQRARDSIERTHYVGPAPVDMRQYEKAMLLQTGERQPVTAQQVKKALSDLILPENFHRRIGPAVNSGNSLFLYGPPGNGKTTIAQAIGKLLAGTDPIWLPYALTVGGQIIQIFDPSLHIHRPEDSVAQAGGSTPAQALALGEVKVDKRWGLFQRPAVMVGGELTMDALDLRFDPVAKIYQAPLQLKANGGMFLIDDFGRQPISPRELLNRWIVPLESGVDTLRLDSGQTLQIPFRQLIVFATNLDPLELVDAAFLRRIQMKVEVHRPDVTMFYRLFVKMCETYKVPFDKNGFMYLLKKWYQEPKREMQSVHPRDIVKTIVSICAYEGVPPRLLPALIDEACTIYFVEKQNNAI